jgi:hypothetical protein
MRRTLRACWQLGAPFTQRARSGPPHRSSACQDQSDKTAQMSVVLPLTCCTVKTPLVSTV